VLTPKHHVIDLPATIQLIRVPVNPIRPTVASLKDSPVSKYIPSVHAMAKNAIIERAIALVNQDQLYATDLYLSETIYTRQSASEGALEATTYLQNRFISFGTVSRPFL